MIMYDDLELAALTLGQVEPDGIGIAAQMAECIASGGAWTGPPEYKCIPAAQLPPEEPPDVFWPTKPPEEEGLGTGFWMAVGAVALAAGGAVWLWSR